MFDPEPTFADVDHAIRVLRVIEDRDRALERVSVVLTDDVDLVALEERHPVLLGRPWDLDRRVGGGVIAREDPALILRGEELALEPTTLVSERAPLRVEGEEPGVGVDLGGEVVWGATSVILTEFKMILEDIV